MNDFFNVLDDFELEEFVPAGEPDSVSTFNLDVDGDTSKGADSWDEDVEYGDAELNKVANTADAITEQNADRYLASDGKYYAWKNGTNPFTNSTSTAGVFFSQTGATTTTNASGYEVTELALNNLDGISTLARVAGLVLEKANGKGFELNASAGLSFTLNNGNLTGGKIDAGEGQFTMGEYDANNADAYTKGDITVTVTGFDPPESEDDLVWTGDETSFDSIVTAGTEGGSVAVENDYNFTVDDNEVKIKNVAAGTVVFTYGTDGIELDLSDLAQDGTDVINVTSAANAEKLVPPTDPDSNDVAGGSIMIAKKTYEYVLGANSEAYFTLNSNGSVEGFVLDVTGDSITVANNQDINVYDEDLTKLVTVDGSGYTVTKNANNYTLTIANTSEVTIGDTTLDFTIKSALAGGKEINITFDEDGVIESVDGLYNLTSTSDKLVVTGPDADSEEEGLPVISKKGTLEYITVSDGDFTLIGGAAGDQQLVVDAGETVYAAYSGIDQLTTGDKTGYVTDNVNGFTYGYTGNGHFITAANGIIKGFVFESKDDSVTLPDGAEDLDLYYLTETAANLIAVPAIADTEGFTVTLSDVTDPTDPQFTISNMSDGAIVPANVPLRNTLTADTDDTFTFDLNGVITGLDGVEDSIVLRNGTYEIDINGDTLTYTAANDITVTGDTSTGLAEVSGLVDGDVVSSTDEGTTFVFASDSTDGIPDIYTVNGKIYRVVNDKDGVTITAGGVVTGLDEDALLQVSEGPITVNGTTYSAEDIATANLTNEAIIGYNTKAEDTLSSFVTDHDYPLFYSQVTAGKIMYADNWLGLDPFPTEQIFRESNNDNLDRSTDAASGLVIFDAGGTSTGKLSTTAGKSVAWVTDTAEGEKNIVLGNHGDAVIMQGDDEYGQVNITVGSGHDTIWVGGSMENDKVVHQANMKTVIDMGGTANTNSVDKIHTYAAANANIVLNNYDETGISGVVLHDPEIPYADNIVDAIQDELLLFEDGGITAIDRDEFDANESRKEGTDRKTRITVNNLNSNHQNMIRLFGYKDGKDTYGDDYGQLVGFTDKEGGVLDASDIAEDLILIGNRESDKLGGSSLKSGTGNDTLFGGENDVIDAGAGSNQIILDAETEDRGAATIILGEGKDTITGLVSGFNGDILNVDLAAADTDVSFDGTNLVVSNKNDKFSATAAVTTEAGFVEQLFVNNNETIKAAIAVEGGTITVGEDAPNFYKAPNGAVDFSAYTGEVTVDMDGDWAQSKVGDDNATFDGMNSLIGGSGNTLFKGGSADETLVAGTGEGSLYGGGGKNNLVGSSSEDKMGSTEFFVLGINNGAQNTISGFEFIENGGGNTATFDALTIDMGENGVTDIKANSDGSVTLAIQGNRGEGGATEKVTIENAAGNEFLVDRGTEFETVAQIAATEVTVNNSYVDFYCATDDANGATVKVGDIASTEIWLDAPDYGNGVDFSNSKFTVVDARGSNAEVLAAGNEIANTIYGGAGNASMWGGSGIVNDVMYGGTGHNEFYFEGYNGNDTIMSANDGDVIQLGVTLDQIDFDGTNITATGVEIKLTDGSSLTVNSTAEVNIVLDDGTTAKVNHATQQFE
ncbi:MAG: hypothetical protein IKO74_04620 [Selenomonadaceae bacterium]|nr:hypothetical protein [Selenomonadaceae bacterium]